MWSWRQRTRCGCCAEIPLSLPLPALPFPRPQPELAFNYRGAGYLQDAPLLSALKAVPPTVPALRAFL